MAVHTASGGDALEINLKCGTLVVPGLWQSSGSSCLPWGVAAWILYVRGLCGSRVPINVFVSCRLDFNPNNAVWSSHRTTIGQPTISRTRFARADSHLVVNKSLYKCVFGYNIVDKLPWHRFCCAE